MWEQRAWQAFVCLVVLGVLGFVFFLSIVWSGLEANARGDRSARFIGFLSNSASRDNSAFYESLKEASNSYIVADINNILTTTNPDMFVFPPVEEEEWIDADYRTPSSVAESNSTSTTTQQTAGTANANQNSATTELAKFENAVIKKHGKKMHGKRRPSRATRN